VRPRGRRGALAHGTHARGSRTARPAARWPRYRPGMSTDLTADPVAAPTEACAPAPVTDVEAPDDERLAQLAKALGHPARVTILRLLTARRTCVTGDVVAELPLAQSTVSEHLRILREAGLVEVSQDGVRSTYCVSGTGLALLKRGVLEL
jgi:ArsR family transcriptional regulator, arsenate/arsenite/antimonite-responsive transcriptional repressor